jgi:hypothetical protein
MPKKIEVPAAYWNILSFKYHSLLLKAVFQNSIWIRIQAGQWIRIRNPDPDPGGKMTQKKRRK